MADLLPDGTLHLVTDADLSTVGRVLVSQNGTHYGGLYYADIVKCADCEYYTAEEKWCRRLGLCGAFNEGGFCSYGTRRDDNGTLN